MVFYRVKLPRPEQMKLSGDYNPLGRIELGSPNFKDIAIPRLCCCCGDKISVEFGNIPLNMKYLLHYSYHGTYSSSKHMIRTVRFPLCKDCKNHIFAEKYYLGMAFIPFIISLPCGFSIIYIVYQLSSVDAVVWGLMLLGIAASFVFSVYLFNIIHKKIQLMKKETCTTGESCVGSPEPDIFSFYNKQFANTFADLNNANCEEVT